jgi:hypothetical protein
MSDDPAFVHQSTEDAREAYTSRMIEATFSADNAVTVRDAIHTLITILACLVVSHRIVPSDVVRLFHKHLRIAAETPVA